MEKIITRSTVAEIFPILRDTHGKTLEEISKKTGIAVSTLIDIEKGRTTPHASTVHRLKKYFDSIG